MLHWERVPRGGSTRPGPSRLLHGTVRDKKCCTVVHTAWRSRNLTITKRDIQFPSVAERDSLSRQRPQTSGFISGPSCKAGKVPGKTVASRAPTAHPHPHSGHGCAGDTSALQLRKLRAIGNGPLPCVSHSPQNTFHARKARGPAAAQGLESCFPPVLPSCLWPSVGKALQASGSE